MADRPLYILHTVTRDDMSVLWEVAADTEVGASAGLDAVHERAAHGGTVWDQSPILPCVDGGFHCAGYARFPGHGAEPWHIESTPFFSSNAAAAGSRHRSRQESAQ
ncbi:hypothetical protein [Ancylobacter defluvii]|uniref:Uncharacterized protein n=1 Tax=Ancylobacter defluvii TaxID=1282440 RepID=A0A9W6NDE7_9HYPH|nr:hypothetical protein [Ancylobacter defluvii]MBS7588254.1 hypothetical protein [Ancylobacter defluvii]GLK86650.1 hypothetical protein GCM10017653_47200 [Ancylobacter defluvii]